MDSASGMSIGQRIALYRRLRGLTQEGLAMRLHRSKSWVTKVERGERSIDSVTALLQVSKALGVEVQKLTGRPYFPEPGGHGVERAEGLSELRRVLMRYDGILGVLAAIEVARCSREQGLELPIQIVSWVEEEASGFGQMLLGSRTASGEPASAAFWTTL